MYFLAGCILHKQPILILDASISSKTYTHRIHKKILPVVGVHIKINYNLKHREPYGYNLKDTYTILPVCHQRYILLLPEKIREARHFQGV